MKHLLQDFKSVSNHLGKLRIERSKISCLSNCRCTGQYPGTTPREHPNKITAYLDANMVYGVTESRCRHLRTYKDGLMIVDANNYMPVC